LLPSPAPARFCPDPVSSGLPWPPRSRFCLCRKCLAGLPDSRLCLSPLRCQFQVAVAACADGPVTNTSGATFKTAPRPSLAGAFLTTRLLQDGEFPSGTNPTRRFLHGSILSFPSPSHLVICGLSPSPPASAKFRTDRPSLVLPKPALATWTAWTWTPWATLPGHSTPSLI
jgi:hypothetical protein